MGTVLGLLGSYWFWSLVVAVVLVLPSIHRIGPTQVGLVVKRFSHKKLADDNPIGFKGEAGYQAALLMPGLRFKFWVLYRVEKHPWVQVPAGEIGVVIAQVGAPLPIGAKSGVYKREFENFADVTTFVQLGGQKGVQRPVLAPGTLVPIHPVGFLVITKQRVYGLPVSPQLQAISTRAGLEPQLFGLSPEQLELTRIAPRPRSERGEFEDVIGIVTTLEGDPLQAGSIASRLGDFDDVSELEKTGASDAEIIEVVMNSKNQLHNNYQDYQKFLDSGGRIGLQHDPLLYGAYNLNPFLVRVEIVPMLVVRQGQVAVMKAYVGLSTQDTSGAEFKFGSLVRPGHRGIWQEPLRTGKYALNPRCYQAEIVLTSILTLNWANAVSQAHSLDQHLKQIVAKSREGFEFSIDLQVQIHIADYSRSISAMPRASERRTACSRRGTVWRSTASTWWLATWRRTVGRRRRGSCRASMSCREGARNTAASSWKRWTCRPSLSASPKPSWSTNWPTRTCLAGATRSDTRTCRISSRRASTSSPR